MVIAAANLVAVRFTTSEIPPFFGAAFRFGVAGVVLICAGLVARLPNPTRRELIGTLLYGLLAFGGAMALGYWALQELPAAIGGTIIATVPVITILLARVQGLETFQWRGLAGGLLTVAGIWFLVSDSGAGNVPLGSGLAMVGGAVCMAEAGIVVKKFPPCHPVVFNGLAMGAGALVLLGVSLSAGEQWAMPSSGDIWLAMAFMILAGSIALFGLYLFVLKSWTASAASFQFVLIPLATALLGFWILDEPVGGASSWAQESSWPASTSVRCPPTGHQQPRLPSRRRSPSGVRQLDRGGGRDGTACRSRHVLWWRMASGGLEIWQSRGSKQLVDRLR